MISTNLQNKYDKVKEILLSNNIVSEDYSIIDYGIQFNIFWGENKQKLRIFENSKKQIKIDYSQIKDFDLKNIILESIEFNNEDLNDELKEDTSFPLIGTDESGKGDYFGPLVISSVYLNKKDALFLKSLGVKDSKKINDKQILTLSKDIINYLNDKFVIIEISPEKYNSLYTQFKNEGKNLNTLLGWGHAKAIEELLDRYDCKLVLTDKFADDKVIINKLQEKGKKIKLIQRHKAEVNLAVATASILARSRFIEKLNKLGIEYNTVFPKGVSQKVVNEAKNIYSKFGESVLKKVVKLHFKTTIKIIK